MLVYGNYQKWFRTNLISIKILIARMTSDFSPNLFHPFYFNRNGLKDGISFFADKMYGKMMDFGCGSKPYKHLFNVESYLGVDFQNDGHPHDDEEIDLFYNGKTIPMPDQYFDSVLSSEVFEHIFNLDEVLKEIHRVMKTGGNLLITCPFVWNEHEAPHDYARYSRYALEDIMQKNGFEVLEFRKSGNFMSTVFQLYNLYWYSIYHRKKNRFVLIRWAYKLLIILPTNIIGKFFSSIFPFNDTLYLNNILLAKKS